MKNTLIILVILTFSCSTDKINLVGDWKATQLVVNNTDSVEVPFFQPTYFKSDSLVIYFERLMKYHMKGDSIIFINDVEPSDTILRYRMEILDENHFTFFYKRKVFDSLNNVLYIPYNSSWERIR